MILLVALFYVFEVYPIIKLVQLIREDMRSGTVSDFNKIIVID